MFTKIISGCSAQIFKMLRQHYHTGKYSLMQTTRTFEYFCTKNLKQCVYVCFVSYENHMFIGRRIFSQLKSSLTESYSKRAAAEKLKWNPNICKIILFFPLIWRNNKLKQSWWVAANDLILILCVQRTKIIAGRVNIFWTEFFRCPSVRRKNALVSHYFTCSSLHFCFHQAISSTILLIGQKIPSIFHQQIEK